MVVVFGSSWGSVSSVTSSPSGGSTVGIVLILKRGMIVGCDGNMILFTSTWPQPSRPIMHRKQEMKQAREGTQYVNVETQMWEKPRQPSDCRMITMREENNNGESTEATTSCTPSSPHGGYNGGNDLLFSLSLTLSLCVTIHIYTYDFRAIYTYGPKGLNRTHSRMCPFQPAE